MRFAVLMCSCCAVVSLVAPSETSISAKDLQEDVSILREALEQLHPGLYRYNSPEEMVKHWETLQRAFDEERTLGEAYLHVSAFLAKIRCGHTYANFVNQSEGVKRELFQQPNKLPFAFDIIEGRMAVTKNASPDDRLVQGIEIVAINGVPVSTIFDTLKLYVKADGSNDAKRVYDLQVTGFEELGAFDSLFPMLFPAPAGTYDLLARDIRSGEQFEASLEAISTESRRRAIERRYGAAPESLDAQWAFKHLNPETAYLRLGTFVTWKMDMSWTKFLRRAFDELKTKQTPNLVIDIRGNEGGTDAVYEYLIRNVSTEPVARSFTVELLKYDRVPETLRPYLDTWDDSFYDLRDRVTVSGNGFFTWRDEPASVRPIRPGRAPYGGRVFLLIDAGNSSGTFLLAKAVKSNRLATLIGQRTGGNQRGINGGQMFFLRLPNSGIEIDIPLIGYFPAQDALDSGVAPDIDVTPTISDWVGSQDAALDMALTLIARD